MISEIIETSGILLASVTAVYGIAAWRREMTGRRIYELAEEALALFYQCRDHLRSIRSPLGYGGEGSSRKQLPNETKEQSELYNRAFVVYERYDRCKEEFNRLFALRYRILALLGDDAARPIEDFRAALRDVFSAANSLPDYWIKVGRHGWDDDKYQKFLNRMEKYEDRFWGTFSDEDELDQRVEQSVRVFESVCIRILRPNPFTRVEKIRSLLPFRADRTRKASNGS